MRIVDSCGGRGFYNTCPLFYEWVVEFRCLNILEIVPMSQYYSRLLPKARTKLNNGKKIGRDTIFNLLIYLYHQYG